jgi:hypothetical protein
MQYSNWLKGEGKVGNVTFTGAVSAQASSGETVTLTISQGGTVIDALTALTQADKSYSATKAYNPGDYTVQAHVDADALYLAADSTSVPFTIPKSSRSITVSVTVA